MPDTKPQDALPVTLADRDALADALERVLFRRCLEKRIDGYTLEAAAEMANVARLASEQSTTAAGASGALVEAVRAALEPVWHWYQSDEHPERPLAEIVGDVVADLQQDRAFVLNPPKHRYWMPGEPDCPRELKAGNGELHTLRCKVCGQDSPRDEICRAALAASAPTPTEGSATPAASTGADELDRDWTKRRVRELVEEGDGFWRPCTGCQESEDGYVSAKDYPRSELFQCQPGSGCTECGGIGVIWDNTDYEDYARFALEAEADAGSATPASAEVVTWLRELASNCLATARQMFDQGDEDAGQEWRVRGEAYGFIAQQIEDGHSPLTPQPPAPATPDDRQGLVAELKAADYEWHGPYGREKWRWLKPDLYERTLVALATPAPATQAWEREQWDEGCCPCPTPPFDDEVVYDRNLTPRCPRCNYALGGTPMTASERATQHEPPAPATPDDRQGLVEAAQFLSDRLDELEWTDDDLVDTFRDFVGHVAPAHYRLKSILTTLQAGQSAIRTPVVEGEG